MHISEGILSAPVLFSGAAIAAAGTAVGLKKLDYDGIAKTGILSASFFVASLIHVPIGPSSVHLILNGIVGLLLGWAAFPAILIALMLQAVFFQFGGITTLGVNTVIMAIPAVICYMFFAPLLKKKPVIAFSAAFACGAFSVLISGLIVAFALMFTEENFLKVCGLILAAHIPVMIIEGVVTAFCVGFLQKVQPDMLPRHFSETRIREKKIFEPTGVANANE
ncbi:cobalt transporter CbiM [Desulfonema magnum]|uniref:Metal transport protein domain-containing protein n=1 Tax=Desulfonema magnum TaxID=45655 RepID=A0A975BKM7_9BACT|nr:cobalt transporter CbiM [Desulfonema magnum]QTA86845.1 Metal transport protein domain-containing protein [Desulfonema magnum]